MQIILQKRKYRTINEIVERDRNEILSKEFYKTLESVEDKAKESLERKGITNPTKDDVLNESYKILGFDQPLDVVARGDRLS